MKHIVFGTVFLATVLGVTSSSHAYLFRTFSVSYLLDSADLVCHGKILSESPTDIEKDTSFKPPLTTKGCLARVQVLNLIKGEASDQINVVFRRHTAFVFTYTQLKKGSQCILFLRKQGDSFRFVDDHNGILEVPPHSPIQYKSTLPANRMVEELILSTRLGKGVRRLSCIKELGQFSSNQVVKHLKELSQERDMAMQGTAYSSLIRLDSPPPSKELSKFFARQDGTQSGQRFGTTAYSNGQLKGAILNNIAHRFNVIGRDFGLEYTSAKCVTRRKAARKAAESWKDFDLIDFLKTASWQDRNTIQVKDNRVIAEIIGDQIDERGVPAAINKTYRKGSRAIAIELLGGKDREIRCAAARAIDRMIAEPHKFPYPRYHSGRRKKKDMDAYVNACRKWLSNNEAWLNDEAKGHE